MRLRTKLMIGSISMILVLGFAFTYGVHRLRMKFMRELLVTQTLPVAELLEKQIGHTMHDHQHGHFQLFLDETVLGKHFSSVAVTDSNHYIRMASNQSRIGSLILPLKEEGLKYLEGVDFYYYELNPDHNEIRIVSAIHNAPSCVSCHDGNQNDHLGYLEIGMNLSTEESVAGLFLISDYAGLLLILGLFFITTVSVHRRYFQAPLAQLKNTIDRIQSGELGATVQISTKGEVKYLADNINHMSLRLQKTQEENDILHKNELDRASQLSTVGELAASVAHEIRNPIAGIKSALEVILLGRQDSKERAILQEMLYQTERVNRTMWALTNYALPKEPSYSQVSIHGILDKCLLLNEKMFEKEKVQIIRQYGADPDIVDADSEQLQQVFLNLILNAYQACTVDPESKVVIRTLSDVDLRMIRIEIEDSGQGIPDDVVEKIFKPFFTTKAKGSGLGLSLCRSIVERHNGNISYTRNSPRGSTFSIVLPQSSNVSEG